MKIQLKRSNVLSSGAAKTPTASQLEYGELAVNYNNSDPAIFLKDSNNNVIRISGVGNISDDGLTNVPDGTTPPSNPEAGNLWYNSDQGRLYIYFTDADSSQWVDASPDSWDPSSYPDLTNSSAQANTLDDRYAMVNGGNSFTGNVGIGTTAPGNSNVSANELVLANTSSACGMTIISSTSNTGNIFFADGTSGTAVAEGYVQYNHAGNYLALGSSNTERMRIDSSGRLLLGTTTEGLATYGDKLTLANAGDCGMTIRSGTSSLGAIYFADSASGAGEYAGLFEYSHSNNYMRFGTVGAERLRIDSSGNVGIGTSSPAKKFHVLDTSGPAQIRITGPSGSSDIYADSNIYFQPNGSTAVTFTSSGNVGIGTSSPSGLLSVHKATSSASNYINITNNATGASSWSNGVLIGVNGTGDAICWQNENLSLLFGTNNIERMRIDSSGRVGIGTTPYAWEASSNSQALQVRQGVLWDYTSNQFDVGRNYYYDGSTYKYGSSSTAERIAFNQGNHIFSNAVSGTANATLTWSERMRIRDNGDVIIGPYRGPATYGTVAANIPYSIKVAPYGWQNGSEIASISMGSHGGTGQDDGQIVFKTGSNVHSTPNALQERARILSTGGITFNGDTAQVNALNDYEEGSCTITMYITGTSTVVAAANNVAYYTKIGNVVNVNFYSGPMYPTVAGTAEIDGLPFTSKNVNSHYPVAVFSHTTAFATDIQNGYLSTNSNNLYPIQRNNTQQASWNTSAGPKYFMFSVTYQTN